MGGILCNQFRAQNYPSGGYANPPTDGRACCNSKQRNILLSFPVIPIWNNNFDKMKKLPVFPFFAQEVSPAIANIAKDEVSTELLCEQINTSSKRYYLNYISWTVVLLVIVRLTPSIPGMSANNQSFPGQSPALLLVHALLAMFLMGLLAYMVIFYLPGKKLSRKLNMLSARKEKRAIGLYIDARKLGATNLGKIDIENLNSLLPTLIPEDACLLSSKHISFLLHLLASPLDTLLWEPYPEETAQLRVSIIQTMTQIGEARAMPIFERLVSSQLKINDKVRSMAMRKEEGRHAGLPLLARKGGLRSIQTGGSTPRHPLIHTSKYSISLSVKCTFRTARLLSNSSTVQQPISGKTGNGWCMA